MDDFDPLIDEMDRKATTLASGAHLNVKYGRTTVFAHGWFMRIHRGTGALRALQDVGFQSEGIPIARSTVEHVAALRWLIAEGSEIMPVLKRGHGMATTKLRTSLEEARDSLDPKEFDAVIESVADATDRSQDNLLHVWTVLANHGTPLERAEYRKHVMRSHPTYQSAATYWDVHTGTAFDQAHDRDDYRHFCAVFLYKGMGLYGQIFDPDPWADFLADLRPRLIAEGAEDI